MKKYALLTMALVIAASAAAVAAEHIVGGTPNTNNTIPFWGASTQMRWQTLWWQTEINEAGDVTLIEWQVYPRAAGAGGTWNGCEILLCHTNLAAVTTTFANNYGGSTPVSVFKGTYVMKSYQANEWVPIVAPTNFTYNNKDNLLIEVSWTSDDAGRTFMDVRSTPSPYPGRIYNLTNATATTGYVTAAYHQYGRITIGNVGVNPTSLGRVKALYK